MTSIPIGMPWFIHLAEGSDDIAAKEYERLSAMGYTRPDTVIIHGVGMTSDQIIDAGRKVRGLIWCPSTNMYLLGKTADIATWEQAGACITLGSDSRLTADGDLLDEMRSATQWTSPDKILNMVTTQAAKLLHRLDLGNLSTGSKADFVIVPSAEDENKELCNLTRGELSLVVTSGVPQIGDTDLMQAFQADAHKTSEVGRA